MTKIATIGNLCRNVRSNISSLNDNRGQRPDAEMPFFNYLTVTDGEASLQLAKQRLWLYDSIFPEKQKAWEKGKALIDNALYQKNNIGVHGATPFLGLLDDDLRFVGQAIRDAKKRTAPAADIYFGRDDVRKGLNPEMQTVGIQGINGENTVFDDVFKAYKEMNPGCFRLDTWSKPYPFLTDDFVNSECRTTFDLMVKLNTQIPTTSHNGLYIFMPFADANDPRLTPATTAAKVRDHQKYFEVMQNISKVSNTNLNTWLKNAVMHKNSFNGNPSVTPEDNIRMLRANPNQSTREHWDGSDSDKIGIAPLILLVIIIACGKLLIGMVQVLKDKEPTALQGLDDIAKRALDFTASGTDFKGIGTGASGGGTGAGQTDEEKCNARTGYKWNATTKTCEKITAGGGGGTDEEPPKPPSKEWIDGVPNAVTATGAAVVLGLATGVIKV
jgi:hypothetical protein